MNINSWFAFSLRVWSTHCVNMRAISFSFILQCKVHLAEIAKFCLQKWLRTTHSREPSAFWKGIFALLWNYDFLGSEVWNFHCNIFDYWCVHQDSVTRQTGLEETAADLNSCFLFSPGNAQVVLLIHRGVQLFLSSKVSAFCP